MTTTGLGSDAPALVPELLERAVATLINFWRDHSSAVLGGSYEDLPGVACIRTGLPVPAFNGVWAHARDVDPATVLAGVESFVGGSLPWNVQLRPGYPSALADALTARRLVVVDRVPLMVLTDTERLPRARSAAYRRLETFADLDAVLSLLEQGFELPAAVTRETMSLAMFFVPGTGTWIARDGGVDVSTALLAARDGTCGVFNVATPPEHRRRGYGADVTAAAVRAGFAAGCDLAYLQSSAAGLGVYERLGFVTAERWDQWVPAAYAPEAPVERPTG
jgi:GNAT superfamily N-acetyltransferase